jgi:hypothetical protein
VREVNSRRGLSRSLARRQAALNIMARFTQFSFRTIAILVLIAGCARGPKMSQADVVQAASRASKGAGYELANYQDPETHYEFVRKDRSWTVFYVRKPPTPAGGHFQVWVDDRTGKARVMPGE